MEPGTDDCGLSGWLDNWNCGLLVKLVGCVEDSSSESMLTLSPVDSSSWIVDGISWSFLRRSEMSFSSALSPDGVVGVVGVVVGWWVPCASVIDLVNE